MTNSGKKISKNIERSVRDILKSRARSRIYIYLLRKHGAKTDEIIKGTNLHPSTVRETLSKMYGQHQIYRRKKVNEKIGKNPYLYYPVPPIELLKRYTKEIEDKLTKIANLDFSDNKKSVKIKIIEKADNLWMLDQ